MTRNDMMNMMNMISPDVLELLSIHYFALNDSEWNLLVSLPPTSPHIWINLPVKRWRVNHTCLLRTRVKGATRKGSFLPTITALDHT